MKKNNIRIIYEYGVDLRPHASSSLRLLRPFSHPLIKNEFEVSVGRDLGYGYPDLVMVDRLWKPGIQPEMVHELAHEVHQRGSKLVYWFDDHFTELYGKNPQTNEQQIKSFQAFIETCDFCVVSTPNLLKAFESTGKAVYLQSALDERILIRKLYQARASDHLMIGYMGTPTHDDDFKLILPVLETVCARYPGKLKLQFIGIMDNEKKAKWSDLAELPIEILQPALYENEYQLFMTWFTSSVRWDIGLAPLLSSSFNRYKSDIKFLDYAAAGIPGIFSKVDAYVDSVQDKQTGLLVDNVVDQWTEALIEMVENPQMRKQLAIQADQYLYGNRILRCGAPVWVKTIQQMVVS